MTDDLICLADMLDNPDLYKMPDPIVSCIAWEKRLTMLAGREKAGKSTLMSAVAGALTTGRDFLDGPTTVGNVLWISYEEPMEDVGRRFLNFNGDPKRFFMLIDPEKPYQSVIKACEEREFSLLIWDSLTRLALQVASKPPESGDAIGWTAVLAPLLDITREYASSTLLHHSRKSDGGYRDSSGIGGVPDVIITMYEKQDPYRLLRRKGRFGKADNLISLEGVEYKLIVLEGLEDRIIAFVKKNPACSWNSLRTGVTGSDGAIQKAKDKLLEDKVITNKGEGSAHEYHPYVLGD